MLVSPNAHKIVEFMHRAMTGLDAPLVVLLVVWSIGFFIFDRVVGKHLYIDYAVALTPSGAVHAVEILQYRESYGGEIRSPSWLAQFVGKTSGSSLKINGDIRNIAGATLSSTHITEGVKRVLAAYGNRLR